MSLATDALVDFVQVSNNSAVSDLQVDGAANVTGLLTVTGNALVVGNLSVSGTIIGGGGGGGSGNITTLNSLLISTTLGVTGASRLASLVVPTTLSVSGASVLGSAVVPSTLSVSGASVLGSAVVPGTLTLQGGVDAPLSGQMVVSGSTYISGHTVELTAAHGYTAFGSTTITDDHWTPVAIKEAMLVITDAATQPFPFSLVNCIGAPGQLIHVVRTVPGSLSVTNSIGGSCVISSGPSVPPAATFCCRSATPSDWYLMSAVGSFV